MDHPSMTKKRKREDVAPEEMEREELNSNNNNKKKKKKKKKKRKQKNETNERNEKNDKGRRQREYQSHRHEKPTVDEAKTGRKGESTPSEAGIDATKDFGGTDAAIDPGGQRPSPPIDQSDERTPALDPPSERMNRDDGRLRRRDRVVSVDSRDRTVMTHDHDDGGKNRPGIGRRQTGWTASPLLGGRMIDADPVFSRDEKLLILAYPSAVSIYSIKASSLVRSLSVTASTSAEAETTAYALSATRPSHLYLANSRGIVYLFDWVQGTKLGRWKLGTKIWDLAVSTHRSSSTGSDTVTDVVYTREQKADRWWISAHRLRVEADASRTESKTILSTSSPITHYHVTDGGLLLIAVSGSRLMVGELVGDATASSLKDLKYIWREVTTPAPINALDVRISTRVSPPTNGQSSSLSSSSPRKKISDISVDVLVGDSNGVIFVHQDLHANLVRRERQSNGSIDVRTSVRRMHWHREAVRTVKWSRDGNYVISGGAETVLVLWQLETDRCQFLPHLAAAIEGIVVSPSGTAYAIRLSDNSTMVLSTSELNAKAYVGGIQAPTPCLGRKNTSSARKTFNFGQAGVSDGQLVVTRAPMVPATISGLDPTRLLLALPSTSSDDLHNSTVGLGGPFLQTVDLTTAHHVARQALARTNVTNVNIGPENNKLVEPSVTLIRASSGDGRWLATVDEWSPPMKDMGPFSITDEGRRRECQRRTEIHLRFWSWDSESTHWQLAARVDGPHSIGGGGAFTAAGRVLDLQADPSQLGFATLGEDYSVRVWKSKARRGRQDGGVAVRDGKGRPMMEWYCHLVVPLRVVAAAAAVDDAAGRFDDRMQDRSVTARLAYSPDGSVLVASQTGLDEDTSGLVYFIDVDAGSIRRTQSGLYRGGLVGLGLVDRYLVTLADQLKVWDVVQDRLCYGFSLLDLGVSLTREQKAAMTHLAIDQSNGTFAVALPVLDRRARKQRREAVRPLTGRVLQHGRSYILVFDATKRRPSPLQWMESPRLVTALAALRGSSSSSSSSVVSGYVVVNGAAQIQTITGPSSTVDLTDIIQRREEVATVVNANDDMITMAIDNQDKQQTKDIQRHQYRFGEEGEEGEEGGSPSPTVGQGQLAAIFDIGPAYSLPPVTELFHRVADVLSKRPIKATTTSLTTAATTTLSTTAVV